MIVGEHVSVSSDLGVPPRQFHQGWPHVAFPASDIYNPMPLTAQAPFEPEPGFFGLGQHRLVPGSEFAPGTAEREIFGLDDFGQMEAIPAGVFLLGGALKGLIAYSLIRSGIREASGWKAVEIGGGAILGLGALLSVLAGVGILRKPEPAKEKPV